MVDELLFTVGNRERGRERGGVRSIR